MSVITSAGTRIYISDSEVPNGYTKSSVEAMAFTEIGEVTSIPDFGRAYAEVTHSPLATRRTVKRKGSYNDGSIALSMARVTTDPGQILLRTALNSDGLRAFRVSLQDDAERIHFVANVSSYTTIIGGSDGITQTSSAIDIEEEFAPVIVVHPPAAPNPTWENVVLAMHMDGSDNGTVFADQTGKIVTRVGNTVTKTAIKKFGTASAYFDGTGDRLTIPDSVAWTMGSGDFTVEMWVNPSSFSSFSGLIGQFQASDASDSFTLGLISDGRVSCQIKIGATIYSVLSLSSLIIGSFSHVAMVRSGTDLSIYIDFIFSNKISTLGAGSVDDQAQTLRIGSTDLSGSVYQTFNGYIDDLRVTKGEALYVLAEYTPPTSAFPNS